jgi:hypothetical protein
MCHAQAGKYDPDRENEALQAKRLGISWEMRGIKATTQKGDKFMGQAYRHLSGRFGNPGGFKKRAAKVLKASGGMDYYRLKNPHGLLACK